MELHFQQSTCPYLKTVVSQVQNQEQTQEIRLSDGMPDIDKVLGCWGQPVIRGKEWRSDSILLSGGMMAWVLYAPEDGGAPQCVEAWLPFQMKWPLPETKRDGSISASMSIKSMNCRSISPRKMMLRGVVSVFAQAFEPSEAEVFAPEQVPEDVQLLVNSYPMELPVECAEKTFSVEEDWNHDWKDSHKTLGFEVYPDIQEQKVLADKLVFRGQCKIFVRWLTDDGEVASAEQDFPFSQFAELKDVYSNHAQVRLSVLPTGVEMLVGESGKWQMKCGLTAQYTIFDKVFLDLVEDAYSTTREVTPIFQEWKLPVRLDTVEQTVPYTHIVDADEGQIVDVSACWEQPYVAFDGETAQTEFSAQYQVMTKDESGNYHTALSRAEVPWEMLSAPKNRVSLQMQCIQPRVSSKIEGAELDGEILVTADVFSGNEISMVTGLELGEKKTPDGNRPAIILRKLGQNRLWDVAKECGSTVEAIERANPQREPMDEETMLLIPVC